MIIKDRFELLTNTENIMRLSQSSINKISVDEGPRKIFVLLKFLEKRINHYTKKRTFKAITMLDKRKFIHVVADPKYILPISYNVPTKGLVLNIGPFGVDDIQSDKPGVMNLYAMLVYGITFYDIVHGKVKVKDSYSIPISDLITSLFVRIFGKQYGLLGTFASEIVKLKFLINCYILDSFFGIKGTTAFKRASTYAAFDYRDIEDQLRKIDFSKITEFISSLANLGVLPNINKHLFASMILRKFNSVDLLAGLEDCSRFVSVIAASNIKGSSLVPSYFEKYNARAYGSVLQITKPIFKGS
jgi:hypothetical protein